MISIWPSLIWLGLTLFGTGMGIQKGTYGWTGFVANLLITGLLYWGGFFDPVLSRLAS